MGGSWGDFVGALIAAGVGTLVISRLCLWLASSLGDTRRKLVLAHAVTAMVTVTLASSLMTLGQAPDLTRALIVCLPTQLVWLVWDVGAQRHRQRQQARATAQSTSVEQPPPAPPA